MGKDRDNFFFKIDKDRIKLQLKELGNRFVKKRSGRRLLVLVITFCLLTGVGLAIYFNYESSSPLKMVERQGGAEQESPGTIEIREMVGLDEKEKSGIAGQEQENVVDRAEEQEQAQKQDQHQEQTGEGRGGQEEVVTGEEEIEGVVTEPLRDISETASVSRPRIELLKPVSGQITAEPGWYYNQLFGDWRYRPGVIMSGNIDDVVMAAEKGEVKEVSSEPYLGITVTITHQDNWSTVYGYLQRAVVDTGQEVAKGQEVGRVGSSGFAEEPALYFELRKGEESVDPAQYL